MATKSGIEWTDVTWNPTAGCSVISPGCSNCYAMRMAARLESMGLEKYRGTTRKSGGRSVWTGKLGVDTKSLTAPLRWRTPRMVFVNSMSDLFHDQMSFEFIESVWRTMELAQNHQFQVLTKRPERMADFLRRRKTVAANVWIGTSVENEDYVSRIDFLRRAPAAIRFVSFEPLINKINNPNLTGVSWVIVGGESGPGARPLDEDWVLELLAATKRQNAAFFFKQWGGPIKKKTGRILQGREWSEFPQMTDKQIKAA